MLLDCGMNLELRPEAVNNIKPVICSTKQFWSRLMKKLSTRTSSRENRNLNICVFLKPSLTCTCRNEKEKNSTQKVKRSSGLATMENLRTTGCRINKSRKIYISGNFIVIKQRYKAHVRPKTMTFSESRSTSEKTSVWYSTTYFSRNWRRKRTLLMMMRHRKSSRSSGYGRSFRCCRQRSRSRRRRIYCQRRCRETSCSPKLCTQYFHLFLNELLNSKLTPFVSFKALNI